MRDREAQTAQIVSQFGELPELAISHPDQELQVRYVLMNYDAQEGFVSFENERNPEQPASLTVDYLIIKQEPRTVARRLISTPRYVRPIPPSILKDEFSENAEIAFITDERKTVYKLHYYGLTKNTEIEVKPLAFSILLTHPKLSSILALAEVDYKMTHERLDEDLNQKDAVFLKGYMAFGELEEIINSYASSYNQSYNEDYHAFQIPRLPGVEFDLADDSPNVDIFTSPSNLRTKFVVPSYEFRHQNNGQFRFARINIHTGGIWELNVPSQTNALELDKMLRGNKTQWPEIQNQFPASLKIS